MRHTAPLFLARRVVGGGPSEERTAYLGHVATRFDTIAVAGKFPSADAFHPNMRIQSQENDEVVQRLERLAPFKRRT